MKKILAVDDERDIRKLLKEYLELEGYLVFTAKNGMEAMEKLKHQPDLIIMDVNMPDMDGYTVCEKIRDYVDCPILFLTARTEEQDRVSGFKAGGDDYIVKPFGMDEMLARVEAHLRREERRQQNSNIYMKGDLTVDFSGRQVLVDGADAGLTKTEFAIVELLITHLKKSRFTRESGALTGRRMPQSLRNMCAESVRKQTGKQSILRQSGVWVINGLVRGKDRTVFEIHAGKIPDSFPGVVSLYRHGGGGNILLDYPEPVSGLAGCAGQACGGGSERTEQAGMEKSPGGIRICEMGFPENVHTVFLQQLPVSLSCDLFCNCGEIFPGNQNQTGDHSYFTGIKLYQSGRLQP